MKKISFDANREKPPALEQRGNRCYANDCRMAGEGSDDPGSSRWLCSSHRQSASAEEWPIVTETLRQHAAVVDVLIDGQRLLNRRPFETATHAQFFSVNREALAQMGYEAGAARNPNWDDCSAWLYRLRSMLSRLVRADLDAYRARAKRLYEVTA